MEDIPPVCDYRECMLDYACQRAVCALKETRKAIFASGGPGGVQAGE
jgi:hypothetical protein